MRVLEIGAEWPHEKPGGIGSYYEALLHHLASVNVEVKGLVLGSAAIAEATGGVIRAFARDSDNMLQRLRGVRREVARSLSSGKIDLVASHFALYAFPGRRFFSSIPSVVHFHGPWASESREEGGSQAVASLKTLLERSVYSTAKRLIVLSQAFERELVSGYGVDPGRVRVIPGGVDVDRFHTQRSRVQARLELGWPLDRPVLFSVRRQVRRMGLDHLIDASKEIVRKCPDVLVFLAGTGPLSASLEQRIVENGLSDHVKRLGYVSDELLPLMYRAADMTLVPSQSLEGFGLITLESLASGTPVFVTPVGGLPEIVGPFAPQCVFPGTTADDMAVVLSEALLGKRELPSEAVCRDFAVSNFSWALIAARVRDVYQEAME